MGRLELAGWLAFLLSGVSFLMAGIVAEDPWVIGGSSLFIVGVLAVMFGVRR